MNTEPAPGDADRSLSDMVEARAELTPDALFAVDERDQELAFAELQRRSHVLAASLVDLGGINWLMASVMSVCGLILLESFGAASTMDVIRRHGSSLLGVTTAFHLAYLAAQRADGRHPLFPAVRAYPGGAAPKPPGLHHDLVREVGGVGIVSGYGLTESPMNAMASVCDPSEKLATTEGRPCRQRVPARARRDGPEAP